MATAVKRQAFSSARTQSYQEPKRLSKFAEWRKENPGGIYTFVDWRAVNK